MDGDGRLHAIHDRTTGNVSSRGWQCGLGRRPLRLMRGDRGMLWRGSIVRRGATGEPRRRSSRELGAVYRVDEVPRARRRLVECRGGGTRAPRRGGDPSESPIGPMPLRSPTSCSPRTSEACAWQGRCGSATSSRAASPLELVAAADPVGYAVTDVLASFEQRDEHLEDVPVADTVLVLQALARRRGRRRARALRCCRTDHRGRALWPGEVPLQSHPRPQTRASFGGTLETGRWVEPNSPPQREGCGLELVDVAG